MDLKELKQKAEAEADKVIIGSGMDRASVIHLKHLLVTMYLQGATETTKELEKENAQLTEGSKALCDKYTEELHKRLDLQKENAELKDYNKKLLQSDIDKLNKIGLLSKKVNDLQKEYAELKTDYKVLKCSVGDFGELQDKLEEEQRKNNGLSDNLTKAKELIQRLLELGSIGDGDYTCVAEAEQFLK